MTAISSPSFYELMSTFNSDSTGKIRRAPARLLRCRDTRLYISCGSGHCCYKLPLQRCYNTRIPRWPLVNDVFASRGKCCALFVDYGSPIVQIIFLDFFHWIKYTTQTQPSSLPSHNVVTLIIIKTLNVCLNYKLYVYSGSLCT